MTYETMLLEKQGALARLTFNRPQALNAQNVRWIAELNAIVDDLAAEEAIRVVIVRGAGRAFCAGIDLKVLAQDGFPRQWFTDHERALRQLELLDKMVVAGIHGPCIGGGVQVAACCDFRVATTDALFRVPAVHEGLVPGMSIYRLPRLIGLGPAKRVVLLGDSFDAHEAKTMGLVDYVVPPEALDAKLAEIADLFLNTPGTAVRRAKQLMRQAFELPFDTFKQQFDAALDECLASPEHATAKQTLGPRPGKS